MVINDIKGEFFSAVGNDANNRLSSSQYILCTRDLNNRNIVIPIFYYNSGKIQLLDPDAIGDKIIAARNKNFDYQLFHLRTEIHELLKISYGNLVANATVQFEDSEPNEPLVKVWENYINQLSNNEIIEIFQGKLIEEKGTFKLLNDELTSLFTTVYEKSERPFFIDSEDAILGPFKFNRINKNGDLIISSSDFYQFGKYEFSNDAFYEFEVNNISRKIIIDREIENYFHSTEKFVTDDELISRFRAYIEKYPEDFKSSTLSELLEFLKRSKSIDFIGESQKTKDRIFNLLSKGEGTISDFLNVSSFISELSSIKDEIEELGKQRLTLTNKIKDQKEEKTANEEKINEQEDQIRELETKFDEKFNSQKDELEKALEDLINRKENLDEEINNIVEEKSAEVKKLEGNIEYLRGREESLQSAIKTLVENFTSQQKASHEKLKELLIANQHYNIISGRNFEDKNEEEYSPIDFKSLSLVVDPKEKFNVYFDFRAQILSILEKNNRKFDSHFIDNIIISIFQNTLTLFAGLPGTGKTSLVKILTKILADERRIREVSVGRGWTSQKDLIGFYNPLSNSFNPSSTGIYNLLLQLNDEAINENYLESPFAFVILDEANLSPLEHYWSSFYNLTDTHCEKGSLLQLNLGKDIQVKYPNNLRFIGTINYDQTTEELSPRVIDRANIIKMSPKNFEIDSISNSEITCLNLTFKDCIQLFELPDFNPNELNLIWKSEIDELFNEIKSKLESLRIFISPRVIIAIKRYYNIAVRVMVDENKPLDYCIAQRILPLINFNGENGRLKLEELLKILKDNNLEISAKILDDIIKIGSEGEVFQDNFNFFLSL